MTPLAYVLDMSSGGVERYFLAANHSLVASWVKVKDELQDLTGTTPGVFVGGPD